MIALSRLELILKSDRNPTREQRDAMLFYFKRLREFAKQKYFDKDLAEPMM